MQSQDAPREPLSPAFERPRLIVAAGLLANAEWPPMLPVKCHVGLHLEASSCWGVKG